MAKKFDAVVIGAGLGGMSAAAMLAKNGKSVMLLERHNVPGGYATSFRRGRFEFDISLHELSGVGSPEARGALFPYLESLGVTEKVEFIPMHQLYRVIDGDLDLTVPAGRDECNEFFMEHFPKETDGIEKFFDAMQDLMKDYGGVIGGASVGADDLTPEKFPNFIKHGMKTYGEVLDDCITDQDLKNALSPYWGYGGLPPSKLPFHLMASIWEAYLGAPPAHIRGTCQALSNAFVEIVLENGGEVKFNCGVKKILTSSDKVTGVITDDDRKIQTSVIVSNANPLSTMIDLLGLEHAPKAFMRDINSRIIGFSTFNVYLGLDCPPEEVGTMVHENFINMGGDVDAIWERGFTLDPPESVLFTNYNATDPQFSPPGTTVAVLLSVCYARPWYYIPPDQYVETKNAYAEALLSVSEKHFPGFRDHIEVIEVSTPVTNMRYTGNPGGTIYGFDQYLSDSGMLRLRHKGPVGGLFFASAWTIPGGGYQPSIMAGSIAAGRALAHIAKGA
ncbi:MAG: NAD(P)/FAD-dependent oxidoreductase [Deltaproteobacteria bacterium]|nr:NAD(P)/FAD-dependent oxidoreductase [Candidatus Zymogenaceae bacterium]